MRGAGAQVLELVGIGLQVIQLLGLVQPVHVAPAVGAHRPGARVLRGLAAQDAGLAETVVQLREHAVAPRLVRAAAMQHGLQFAPFQPVPGPRRLQRAQHRRHQVHAFHHVRQRLAAGGVGRRRRVHDDEGHPLHGVVEQFLLAQPVVAQEIAMVRREHDERVAHQARAFHVVEQPPQVVVELADQALVGRAHHAHALVGREADAFLVLAIGRHHRMRAGQFLAVAPHRQALVGRVALVVGRRRHVGPVRLDVAQVQHPGLAAALLHEAQRLVGHVGGFGVRLGHARRQVRVAHVPAADHLAARVDPGDDVVGPGIGAVVALAAQEGGIAAFLARLVVAVVAVDLDEAAARQQRAQL
ncbi:Uncharacterised protein [Achromobacter xylosoxidans]|nr:Uncharacterised protein [Achromobacter xylosoxidans]